MAAVGCKQHHLILLYQGLVHCITEYALAILTRVRSHTHLEKLDRLQNEGVCIIFGCSKYIECRVMCYLLDFPTMEVRT